MHPPQRCPTSWVPWGHGALTLTSITAVPGFLCEMLLVIYINVYFYADAEAIQLLFLTNVSQTKVIKDVRFVRAMLFSSAITGGMFYPFFTYWCFPIKGHKYEKINI
ncbi:hypothetical protein PCO86_21515 [Pectobacteriaceae bacterium CE70]|nr:hypothetical protein PCO87_22140 [Pectobacteriaceae bacterium C52]WJV66776.1 hypothetical protein PCO86_21515 [Pectobacteriaceae bacterium CE70]